MVLKELYLPRLCVSNCHSFATTLEHIRESNTMPPYFNTKLPRTFCTFNNCGLIRQISPQNHVKRSCIQATAVWVESSWVPREILISVSVIIIETFLLIPSCAASILFFFSANLNRGINSSSTFHVFWPWKVAPSTETNTISFHVQMIWMSIMGRQFQWEPPCVPEWRRGDIQVFF